MTEQGWIVIVGIAALAAIAIVVVIVSRSSTTEGKVGPFGIRVDSKGKPAGRNASTKIGGSAKQATIKTAATKGNANTEIEGDVEGGGVTTESKD